MSEMMDDTMEMLDDDVEELDEEADQEVDKVLWELTEGKLGQAGKVGTALPVRLAMRPRRSPNKSHRTDTRRAGRRNGRRRCGNRKDAGSAGQSIEGMNAVLFTVQCGSVQQCVTSQSLLLLNRPSWLPTRLLRFPLRLSRQERLVVDSY